MKRYDNFSKEEIIDIMAQNCQGCKVGQEECNRMVRERVATTCSKVKKVWITSEIETIPRAWTFKTAREMEDAYEQFREEHCENTLCSECKYSSSKNNGYPCKSNWLYEGVEKHA